ncbi:FAD-binding oxidoreductase [Kitasatospora aureofaciens]|uniref:FAD-binding oxidoreductase n=1 Tax=Kitasatospora aureofaciens TaxID=1894 RepID=UPI001C46C791|nr:FAD-dependent oxidoreductase [Kitasatospora aureofaciens]MBV6697771.1 FAD-dependent oxidoreductase [Kitasatospora aureofaciens]
MQLITPDHPDYDRARRVRNARADRRPAAIARCASPEDVQEALAHARRHRLPVAVRGGGANVAGWGTCDGGVVFDLSTMKRVTVDPDARAAEAEPGLLWGELDAATQRHGLALPGPRNPEVGIAGHTLGGGVGDLSRQYGLTSDNVLFFDLVTADGRRVRASADEHPELFWGLRGGGGNFGVVVRFGFRLHPVSGVVAGPLVHPAEHAPSVLRTARDWLATAPDQASLVILIWTAPPLPFVPEHLHFERSVVLIPTWFGDPARADEVLGPLRYGTPMPLADAVRPMAYTAYQRLLPSPPDHTRQHVYNRGELLADLSDATIDDLLARWASGGPNLSIVLGALGGAIGRAPAGPTAYTHRDARWFAEICAQWYGEPDSPAHLRPARDGWRALQPVALGPYANLLPDPEPEWVRAVYGPAAHERLVRLKTVWDPDNVFRFNANIRPLTTRTVLPRPEEATHR